jgi:hypothetical protein
MIKASVVLGLLKSLETYVARLESLKPGSLEEWNQGFIVHQYLGVDPVRVFTVMTNDLDDFRQFAEYIGNYLRREGVI